MQGSGWSCRQGDGRSLWMLCFSITSASFIGQRGTKWHTGTSCRFHRQRTCHCILRLCLSILAAARLLSQMDHLQTVCLDSRLRRKPPSILCLSEMWVRIIRKQEMRFKHMCGRKEFKRMGPSDLSAGRRSDCFVPPGCRRTQKVHRGIHSGSCNWYEMQLLKVRSTTEMIGYSSGDETKRKMHPEVGAGRESGLCTDCAILAEKVNAVLIHADTFPF